MRKLLLLMICFISFLAFSLYFYTQETHFELWISNVLLSIATGLVIAFYFSRRDQKIRKHEMLIREIYDARDFLYRIIDFVLYSMNHKIKIDETKLYFLSRSIPLFMCIKEQYPELLTNINIWSEKSYKLEMEYDQIKNYIEEYHSLLNSLSNIMEKAKSRKLKI